MKGRIVISSHTQESMSKRGYYKRDLIHGIMSGSVFEVQHHNGGIKWVIAGYDADNLPIILVVAKVPKLGCHRIVTVMPPIRSKFKEVI